MSNGHVLVVVASASLLWGGCRDTLIWNRTFAETGVTLRDGTWKSAQFLEPKTQVESDANGIAAMDFDLVAADTTVYLGANFYHAGFGKRIGYQRAFVDDVGWSTSGSSGFGVIAQGSGSNSLFHAAVGKAPTGELFFAFHETASSGRVLLSQYDPSGATWTLADPACTSAVTCKAYTTTNIVRDYSELSWQMSRATQMVFDSSGNAFLFSKTTNGELVGVQWTSGGVGFGAVNTVFASTSSVIPFTVFHDTISKICVTATSGPITTLYVQCFDEATPFVLGTATNLLDMGAGMDTANAHDSATNEDGTTLVISHQTQTAANPSIYASIGTGDVWPGSPQRIDSGMGAAYEAYGENYEGPQVVSLGGGDFMTAWIALDDTTDPTAPVSALFYAIYDADDGWGTPQMIGSAQEYESRSYYRSLALFGDGEGRVGLAVRAAVDEGSAAESDSMQMQVSLYSPVTGWLALENAGGTCTPDFIKATAGALDYLGFCTQRAKGVFLPSGRVLVVFSAQDGAARFRLASVVYE